MLSKYAHKTAHADYLIRVAVRFKHIRDTIKECNARRELYQSYVHAQREPHFPVPALRTLVYMDSEIVYIVCNGHVATIRREHEADSDLY